MPAISKELVELFHRALWKRFGKNGEYVRLINLKKMMRVHLGINVNRKETFEYNLNKLIDQGRIKSTTHGYEILNPHAVIPPKELLQLYLDDLIE